MKSIAILQSNYIPWKGYFDIINAVDEFVIYDECQYTKRDWRNRNQIKTSNGLTWLTIPVMVKKKYTQCICHAKIESDGWINKHLRTIHHNYHKAKFYAEVLPFLESLYFACRGECSLSLVNYNFLSGILQSLNIDTSLLWSMDIGSPGTKGNPQQRILDICLEREANVYVSGTSAKSYIDESHFAAHGVKVAWMKYGPYPEYEQLFPPFAHNASIIDLMMHVGLKAVPEYGFRFQVQNTHAAT